MTACRWLVQAEPNAQRCRALAYPKERIPYESTSFTALRPAPDRRNSILGIAQPSASERVSKAARLGLRDRQSRRARTALRRAESVMVHSIGARQRHRGSSRRAAHNFRLRRKLFRPLRDANKRTR